jgi:hypothetical protein
VATDLKSSVLYLCGSKTLSHFPLSLNTLRYLTYLAHWKYALVHGQPLTDATWVFTRRGPESGKFLDTVFTAPELTIIDYQTHDGAVGVSFSGEVPTIGEPEKAVLDFVLTKEAKIGESDLQRLVYSTYPMLTTPRFKELDLINKVEDYVKMLRDSGESEGEIKLLRSA